MATAPVRDWFVSLEYPNNSLQPKYITLKHLTGDIEPAVSERISRQLLEAKVRKPADRSEDGMLKNGLVIGRGKEDGSVERLVSAVVSKTHCVMNVTPSGHVYLTDLGSAHGTTIHPRSVGSKPIALGPFVPGRLMEGDRITFGRVVTSGKAVHKPLSLVVRYRLPSATQLQSHIDTSRSLPSDPNSGRFVTSTSDSGDDVARLKMVIRHADRHLPDEDDISWLSGPTDPNHVVTTSPPSSYINPTIGQRNARSVYAITAPSESDSDGTHIGPTLAAIKQIPIRKEYPSGRYGITESLLYISDGEDDEPLPRSSSASPAFSGDTPKDHRDSLPPTEALGTPILEAAEHFRAEFHVEFFPSSPIAFADQHRAVSDEPTGCGYHDDDDESTGSAIDVGANEDEPESTVQPGKVYSNSIESDGDDEVDNGDTDVEPRLRVAGARSTISGRSLRLESEHALSPAPLAPCWRVYDQAGDMLDSSPAPEHDEEVGEGVEEDDGAEQEESILFTQMPLKAPSTQGRVDKSKANIKARTSVSMRSARSSASPDLTEVQRPTWRPDSAEPEDDGVEEDQDGEGESDDEDAEEEDHESAQSQEESEVESEASEADDEEVEGEEADEGEIGEVKGLAEFRDDDEEADRMYNEEDELDDDAYGVMEEDEAEEDEDRVPTPDEVQPDEVEDEVAEVQPVEKDYSLDEEAMQEEMVTDYESWNHNVRPTASERNDITPIFARGLSAPALTYNPFGPHPNEDIEASQKDSDVRGTTANAARRARLRAKLDKKDKKKKSRGLHGYDFGLKQDKKRHIVRFAKEDEQAQMNDSTDHWWNSGSTKPAFNFALPSPRANLYDFLSGSPATSMGLTYEQGPLPDIQHSHTASEDHDSSSDGPITPKYRLRTLKRTYEMADLEDGTWANAKSIHVGNTYGALPAYSGPAPTLMSKRIKAIGSTIGLIALGAALGSVGTVAGLMQMAE